MEYCECGHFEDDHAEDDEGNTICTGDGKFDNGDPICDCDLFVAEEEEEVE